MRVAVAYFVCFLAGISNVNSRNLGGGGRTRNFCPLIKITNGRSRSRGAFIQYSCIRGFTIVGEKYSKCQGNGTWDNEPPRCVKGTCLTTPKNPGHGYMHMTHKKAVYTFYCEPGYDLQGDKAVFCEGKTWEGKVPSCIESGKEPNLFCDFESADLCGWNHDVNHDFDWLRHNKKTPSYHLGTGPSHDITKGTNGDGYYMYTEATSKNHNDTARLISPIFKRSYAYDEYCFSFYYHMYGIQSGQLRVYNRPVTSNDNWNLSLSTPIFLKEGNQENAWHFAILRLGLLIDDFQIIFEAKRGPGYLSDIAIDNVRLIPNCTNEDDILFSTTENYETDSTNSYGTCVNRCGEYQIVSGSSNNCYCDYDCLYKGNCCPDYISECMDNDFSSSTNEYLTSTDYYDFTTDNYTYTGDDYTQTDYYETTDETTTKKRSFTFDVMPTIEPNAQTTKENLNITQTNAKTTKEMSNLVPTVLPTVLPTELPTVVPTTTPTVKPTTKTTTKKVTKKPLAKKTTFKTKTTKRKVPATTKKPKPTKKITTTTTGRTTPIKMTESDVREVPHKKEYDDQGEVLQGKADSSKYDEKKSNNSNTGVVIGLISGCCIVLLFVGFLIHRYVRQMGKSFMGKSYRSNRSRSSMSDVRFLADEEQLDFTLRTD